MVQERPRSRAECKRVRLRRIDACWADAGCDGGGMRSRVFVGVEEREERAGGGW